LLLLFDTEAFPLPPPAPFNVDAVLVGAFVAGGEDFAGAALPALLPAGFRPGSMAPVRSLACLRRLADRLTAAATAEAVCCSPLSSALLLLARSEPERRIFGNDGSRSMGLLRRTTALPVAGCRRGAPESTEESRVLPPGRRCRGDGDRSKGFLMTVAEMWPSRRLGDGLRDLKSNFSPMCESQAWVGARNPPLAVASVVGVFEAGGTPLRSPVAAAAGFLFFRLPANSMSSLFRVFSLTFPSPAVVVVAVVTADGAEVRRLPVSFSLLLDTEEPDSVDALRWSFVAVPLIIDLALGLACGEAWRVVAAVATGEVFLTGEAFLVGDA
jgi:hypothetical protein